MVQQVEAIAALSENPGSLPALTQQLTTTGNSKRSDTFSPTYGLYGHPTWSTYIHVVKAVKLRK